MRAAAGARPLAVLATVLATVAVGGCSATQPTPEPQPSPAPSAAAPVTAGPTTGEGTSGTPGSQRAVVAAIDGDRRGGCVETDGARDVRSGGLAAGPFDEVGAGWGPDSTAVRLYVVPEHPRTMPGLDVRGRLVGSPDGFRGTHRATSQVDDFRFYDVELDLPAAGTWRIRAVSGPDAGCWLVTLG